jgi:hypothetical protein
MHRSNHSWWIVVIGISIALGAYGVHLDRQVSRAWINSVNPQPAVSASQHPVEIVYQTSDPQVASVQENVINQAASKWAGSVSFVKVDSNTASNREHLAALGFDSAKTKFVVLKGDKPLNTHAGFLDEKQMDAFIRESGVSGPPPALRKPVMR